MGGGHLHNPIVVSVGILAVAYISHMWSGQPEHINYTKVQILVLPHD